MGIDYLFMKIPRMRGKDSIKIEEEEKNDPNNILEEEKKGNVHF